MLLTVISVILAALVLVAKETLSVVSSIFREGLPPLDHVSVFIEDVKFEYPTIPDSLLHRSAGTSEISRLVEDNFSSLTETLIVTNEEAERINNLSKAYRYLNEIIPGEPYELKRIYDEFIRSPLYLSNRFLKLPDTMNAWVDFLIRHKADNQNKKNIMENFISQEVARTWLQFPDLLKCLVDLIFAREIKFELPAYHTDDKGCDLRLMSVNTADDLVNEGRNLIIVALVGTNLHIPAL